jgi:hypothetical protein
MQTGGSELRSLPNVQMGGSSYDGGIEAATSGRIFRDEALEIGKRRCLVRITNSLAKFAIHLDDSAYGATRFQKTAQMSLAN